MRWIGVVLVVLGLSRVAGAAVTSNPTLVDIGSAAVGATTSAVNATLSSDAGNVVVHFELVAGCGGTFTFPTTVNVNPSGTVGITFTGALPRGQVTCTVNVLNPSEAVIGTFQVRGRTLAPVITVTPASRDYGNVRESLAASGVTTGPGTSAQVFTVTNTGDTSQTLSISAVASDNAAEFAITAVPAGTAPFAVTTGSAAWTVTFNPSATGTRSATLTFTSNDPVTPMRTVALTGNGTTGVIGVTDIAFGIVTAGGGTNLTTSITNSGTGTLTLTSATLDQASTWFSFTSAPTGSLTCSSGTASVCNFAGGTIVPTTKTLGIRCAPPAAASGTQNATLTIASDTDGGGDDVVDISCTAGRPNIAVDMTPLDFGNQLVGTTSTAQTVTVTNTGNAPLTFYMTKTGTHAGMFTVTGPSGCGIDTNNRCTAAANNGTIDLTVTFTPTPTAQSSMGAKSATLQINSNDPDAGDGVKTVELDGVGIAPIASKSADVGFGDVEVGMTSSGLKITVTNSGTSNLTVSNAGLTAASTEYTVTIGTVGAQTTVIAPAGAVEWTLVCNPTSQGDKSAIFRIASNGLQSTTLDVNLACTGRRGFLVVNPTSFDFGGVRAGDTRMTTFSLQNTGNLPVTNISYVLDAKLLGFTVTNAPTSLIAGASATVTLTFMPATANDGCMVVNAGDCGIVFSGDWGVTPTKTMATFLARGDGLNATYDTQPAAPNALDFGAIRFDATPTMALQVINTGGSPLQIRDLTYALGATTAMGELRTASCTHNNVVVPCPNLVANMAAPGSAPPFALNGVNDTLIVNVMCDPANRIGMIDGTLTVTSDLAANQMPARSVPLKCVSTTAELTLDPATMVLDFGATDLDAVPVAVTRTIVLRNTGVASLNLGAATKGGANLPFFTFSATPANVVGPGGMFSVDVTYLPTSEKSPTSPDLASITFPITGIAPATPGGSPPTSVTLNISGYGADRHINVGATPTFPDTFKNPGSAAPVMPVTITNTGFAPLNLTAVMLDNEPIWTLQNPDPVTIPADSSHDFNVVFAPVNPGKAPTGHLVVMNNDNERTMVSVDLNGNGLDRNVMFGPTVIPLGFTGIGIPIRLSDISPDQLLQVVNSDPINGFTITRIEVNTLEGAEGTFEIVEVDGNEPDNLELAPGGARTFDVTFTPNEVGDFEATATLYLDEDQSNAGQVTLRGRGLYVDARGGGGCATSSGSRGWLVLVLGALLVGARRRRRGAVAAAVVALAVPTSAAAQSRNLDLNVFDPTPATVGTTFHVQNADVSINGSWSAFALFTYANNALVLDTSQNDDAAVKNRTVLALGGSYVFGGRFEAGAHVPVFLQSGDPVGDPEMQFGVPPAEGTSLGDASLHFKARMGVAPLAGGSLTWGFGGTLTLPTASDGEFAGNNNPTGRVMALGSLSHRRLTTTLNAGGILRTKTQFANITQGSGVVWGAGATYRVLDKLWASGELFGELIPGGKTDMSGSKGMLNTIEGLGGVHYRPARTMSLGIALGRGVTSGPGTPAVRGILTFSYTPSADDLKPIHPPRPKLPPKDDDGDGIANTTDECPVDMEDMDGFKDTDGCPETDNDSDGIADAADKCPVVAEDRDRFEDDDGCPDVDNDGDAIADAKDKCPLAAEDKDGFNDTDGCPDPDNDLDGLVDSTDKCPKEPEVINGNDDDDGCPDKGNSFVVLSPDRIELLEAVPFTGPKVGKAAANVLGQLGATLRAHPEILRVRLTAHVQPTRNAAADLKLSEARAKAVREWLVDWGVDPLRLQTSGFGGKQPLVPPTTKGAKDINDRLELIILERK